MLRSAMRYVLDTIVDIRDPCGHQILGPQICLLLVALPGLLIFSICADIFAPLVVEIGISC